MRIAGAVVILLLLSLITVDAFRGRGRHGLIRPKPAWKHRPGDMLVAFDISSAEKVGIDALKVKLEESGFEIIAKKSFEKDDGPKDYLFIKGPMENRALLPGITEATGFKAHGLGSKKDIGFARRGPRMRYVKLLVPKENVTAFIEGAAAVNVTTTIEDGYVLVVAQVGEGADGYKIRELIGRMKGVSLAPVGRRPPMRR